ncbi:MAG TPA: hypothetical protein VGT60_07980 [Candidatus Limnocylindria bacterium]|nr:hypothetical protein [Candidatus Limnocylindria bacterium]
MGRRSARLALAGLVIAACGPLATVPSATPSGGPPTAIARSSGTSAPTRPPLATSSGTIAIAAPERDAWARIRAALPPGSPVAMPTWLPATLDRGGVLIDRLSAQPGDPRYVVTYRGAGRSIEFGMGGDGPPDGGSGLGTRVRRSPAVLSFPSALFTDPSAPGDRVLKWKEAGHLLWVRTASYPGGDLLRVGWELDEVTAPRASYVRVKDGACASATKPEDTVDRLLALIGSGDQDAVLDCFALDVGLANWATLPTTTDRAVRSIGDVGGRRYVQGSWRFTSEPAFWTQGSTGNQFFQLGIEGGRWRVFEGGTAAYGAPP